MHERVTRSLVATPRILIPVAGSPCFFRWYAPHVVIEQPQHVGQPIDAELSDNTVNRQIGPDLHGTRTGSLDHVDHPLLIAVLLQTGCSIGTAVCCRQCPQRIRDIPERILPAHAYERIVSTIIKHILRAQFGRLGQRRETSVRPLLPALSQYGTLQTVRTVNPSLHCEPVGASSRIPGLRGPVAVQICAAFMVVVLFAANHHAVANKRLHATHMCIIGMTDPGKRVVIAVLVEVDFFPVAIRVFAERVLDADCIKGPAAGAGSQQVSASGQAGFQESASRGFHACSSVFRCSAAVHGICFGCNVSSGMSLFQYKILPDSNQLLPVPITV